MIDYLPFIDDAIAYDDVLLVPKYSDIRSRSIPNISSNVGRMKLSVPVVSSPMDTVTEAKMALDIGLLGGLGIIHRFMTPEEQVMNLRFVAKESSLREVKVYVVPAIGVGLSERERFRKIISGIKPFSIDAVAIDIANGHSILMKDTVDFVRDLCGDSIDIIAGNVATGDGFHYLADLGVNAVRVGIGGGSICKTRIMTGFGVPTLTSVIASSNIKKRHPEFDGVSILADGGIRYPADLVKSIVAGADAIVAGKILAGTDSSPNEVVMISGEKKKMYRGMASLELQNDKRGGLKPGTCPEGVATYIPHTGSLEETLRDFSGGLRSAMTYAGSYCIDDLRGNSRFVKITGSGISESHAFGTRK